MKTSLYGADNRLFVVDCHAVEPQRRFELFNSCTTKANVQNSDPPLIQDSLLDQDHVCTAEPALCRPL